MKFEKLQQELTKADTTFCIISTGTHEEPLLIQPSLFTEIPTRKADPEPYIAHPTYTEQQLSGSNQKRKQQNAAALASDDPEFIHRNFTGLGGLHDVRFQDHGNFHDYTKAKQEFELGQFFTPAAVCQLIIEMLEIEPDTSVADICCGMGQFFNYLPASDCYGIEIEDNAFNVAKKLYPNANIQLGDMRSMQDIPPQDYILGNPPFNLQWDDTTNPLRSQQNKLLSQDFYLYQSCQHLKPGGLLCFICPDTWPNDELRHAQARQFLESNFTAIFEVALPGNTFQNYGVTHFKTKILCFQKTISDQPASFPTIRLTYQDARDQWRISSAYQAFLDRKQQAREYQIRTRHERYFQLRREADQDRVQEDQYRKLLYEIKRTHPAKAGAVIAQYNEIGEATCPQGVSFEKWDRTRPTLPKLLTRMRRTLSARPQRHRVRLVKTKNALRLQPDSHIAARALSQADLQTSWNLHKLVNHEHWQQESKSFSATLKRLSTQPLVYRTKNKCIPIPLKSFCVQRYLRRKRHAFKHYRSDISQAQACPGTVEQLQALRFGDKQLLPHQVEDVAKALTKPAALLNWEMGTGKTLAAIAWSKLRTGQTLVVAPSILIRKTWKEELADAGEQAVQIIERVADVVDKAQNAAFILISLERLPKYYRYLKRLPIDNLIVDESDNIKNKASLRAKALRSVARTIGNKLLLTGTFTRNNAIEAYNQLELLLNNSTAFLCEVPELQEYDQTTNEYVNRPNPLYQLPYPARGGHNTFRKNFSPKKTTVFGAHKTNQELYNKQALDRLIRAVRLRRRFDEVRPAGVTYDIQQVTVPMLPAEVRVYEYIFEQFAQLVEKEYRQQHDGRVARMLVIMRQITALLQAVSHPWTFPGYEGPEISSKMQRVIEIIRDNPDKKIMFGSPWKQTAERYAQILARDFDVISLHSEMSITKRNALLQEYRQGDAQVLVSTLGVLKAGVNIPEAEIVITDSYPWNFAQLSQYFFRAIRLNATNHTQVYCLSNEGSFDTNVFNLLLAKERVNTFIQDSQTIEASDVAEHFGVNEEMLTAAIQLTKQKSEGKTRSVVTWGDSVVTVDNARAEE